MDQEVADAIAEMEGRVMARLSERVEPIERGLAALATGLDELAREVTTQAP